MSNLTEFILNDSLIEYYIIDANTLEFVEVNQAAATNSGYSREELLGETVILLMPQHTLDSLKKLMAPFTEKPSTEPVLISNVHTRRDGSTYPVDVHLQFTRFNGREVFSTYVYDSSERQLELDQLRQVIRGARLGYWDFNETAGTYFVDDNWLAMLGLERGDIDESKRTDWHRFIHPDDLERLRQGIRHVEQTNGSYTQEFRMLHKDGHVVWVESAGAVVDWDYNRNMPRRLSGTHLDISERKRFELEREQYHQLFTLADDLMAMTDSSGLILKVNPAWERTLGYAENELLGKPYFDLVHEEDLDAAQRELTQVIERGYTRNFENRNRCKDGSYRWISWNARHDENTQVTFATGRDITEKKAAEESLRSQEEIYRSLLENSEDLVILFDKNHKYLYANPAVEKAVGVGTGELVGRSREDMNYPKELRDMWARTIDSVFASGEAQKRFFEFVTPQNETVHVDWLVFPGTRDDMGRVESVFSVSRDVTQWRKVEEELQKMQRLNSIGVLAGGIAHDFNNILTILFGNIAMARRQINNPYACEENLDKAEVAFHRASSLTSQLLTFAKGGDPVKQNLSLTNLVEETVKFDLSGSNVKLELQADDNLWAAEADKGQISQVFSNLAINADQAMPNGGTLSITLKNVELEEHDVPGLFPGRYIQAVVVDEGVGINRDDIDRIFDPFYTTKQTGSGLGLATVYSIIVKHGGLIRVSSMPGAGAEFCLFLPASQEPAELAPRDIDQPESDLEGGQRILVMDDEEMICDLAANILALEGFQVDTVFDGEQAIAEYRRSLEANAPYDCLIMDLTIPGGLGGKEAVKQILALNPAASAIVSSGYGADPVMANYADYGFKGVISKPFTRQALVKEVKRLVGGND